MYGCMSPYQRAPILAYNALLKNNAIETIRDIQPTWTRVCGAQELEFEFAG